MQILESNLLWKNGAEELMSLQRITNARQG